MSREFRYRVTVDTQQIQGAAQTMRRAFETEMGRINVQSAGGTGRGGASGGSGGLINSLTGSLGGALVGGLAGYAGIQGVKMLANQAGEMANYATSVRRTSVAFELLSGSSVNAAEKLQAVQRASDGGIDKLSAMNIANRAAALGMANTASELERVTKFATISGRVLGVDTAQALDNMALAASNLSFARLDQLGISSSEVRKRFQELKGTMSDSEAFLQAMLETGERTFAGLNDGAILAASGMERLNVAWKDFLSTQTGPGTFLDQQAKNLALILGGGVSSGDRRQIVQERIDRLGGVKNPNDNIKSQLDLLNQIAKAADLVEGKNEKLRGKLLEAGSQLSMPGVFEGMSANYIDAINAMITATTYLDAEIRTVGQNATIMSKIFNGQVFTSTGGAWTNQGAMIGPKEQPKGWTAPGTVPPTGAWSVEGIAFALQDGADERKALDERNADAARTAWVSAGKDTASAWKGAISGIAGLPGTGRTSVTQDQMDAAAGGQSQRFADSFLREAEDELKNGVDWPNIERSFIEQITGTSGLSNEQLFAQLDKQYQSGQLFANPFAQENVDKIIDFDAVGKGLQDQKDATTGLDFVEKEMAKRFGGMDFSSMGQTLASGVSDVISDGTVDFAGAATSAIGGQFASKASMAAFYDMGVDSSNMMWLGFSGDDGIGANGYAAAFAAVIKDDIKAYIDARLGV